MSKKIINTLRYKQYLYAKKIVEEYEISNSDIAKLRKKRKLSDDVSFDNTQSVLIAMEYIKREMVKCYETINKTKKMSTTDGVKNFIIYDCNKSIDIHRENLNFYRKIYYKKLK